MEATSVEQRLAILEMRYNALAAQLASALNMAAMAQQAAQQSDVQNPPQNGPVFECITTGAVTARLGTTMGNGSFDFVDTTGGILTTLTYGGTGYNDNKNAIASGVYCKVVYRNGQWEFLTADSC